MNRILILLLLCVSGVYAQSEQEKLVFDKIKSLNKLVKKIEKKGFNLEKEKMTLSLVEIFIPFIKWDELHINENKQQFDAVKKYKANAEQMAINLPDFEWKEVDLLLDEVFQNINKIKNKKLKRNSILKIDWTKLSIDGADIKYFGAPVFLSDYTWQPKTTKISEYFGAMDGAYISGSHVVNEEGEINAKMLRDLQQKPTGGFGSIFINHRNVPDWMSRKFPETLVGASHYTGYDIDHSLTRSIIKSLLNKTASVVQDKKYSRLGYMLTNEPHWNSIQDTWSTHEFSPHTLHKFKIWLANIHVTIQNLNAVWGTDYTNFMEVDLEVPIHSSLKGTPQWYDWMRFNMMRVTQWFNFMKKEIRSSDGVAKVHIKVMPNLWTEHKRDHGLDFEALTELSDVIGNDAAAWKDSSSKNKSLNFKNKYAFHWREIAMSYDFFKSVSPNKIIYNSENHFISTTFFRDLYLKPSYARATYWLGTLHGLNISQTWYWSRRVNGAPKNIDKVDKGYAGSINHQPRIINEIESTMMDLNANGFDIAALQKTEKPIRLFYSETSAIIKEHHMDDLFKLYESLYFEGVGLGFTTANIIKKQKHELWDHILLYDTEFITEKEFLALQKYLDQGGVIIKDKMSATKDEYGIALSYNLKPSKGKIIIKNTIDSFKEESLKRIHLNNRAPLFKLTEKGEDKVCFWKSYTENDGRSVISIVNLGKRPRDIKITLQSTGTDQYKNLLTGEVIDSSFTIESEEVFLLEAVLD